MAARMGEPGWCDGLKRAAGPGSGLPEYQVSGQYDDWDAVCDLPTAFFVPQLLDACVRACVCACMR